MSPIVPNIQVIDGSFQHVLYQHVLHLASSFRSSAEMKNKYNYGKLIWK